MVPKFWGTAVKPVLLGLKITMEKSKIKINVYSSKMV